MCGVQNQLVCKGVDDGEFQNFLVSDHSNGNVSECWDSTSFSFLNNHAVDVLLFARESYTEFWKSLNASNAVKVFQVQDDVQMFDHQLFWRGTLRMKDPLNHSNFRHLEHTELSYAFDELDLLVDRIKNTSDPTLHNSQVKIIQKIFNEIDTTCFVYRKERSASALTLN